MKIFSFFFGFQFVGQQSEHHGASSAGSNNNNNNNPQQQVDGVLPSPTHSDLSNSNSNIVPERTAPQTGQILRDVPQTARQRMCVIYGRRYKI
jgi:hypothetical protein